MRLISSGLSSVQVTVVAVLCRHNELSRITFKTSCHLTLLRKFCNSFCTLSIQLVMSRHFVVDNPQCNAKCFVVWNGFGKRIRARDWVFRIVSWELKGYLMTTLEDQGTLVVCVSWILRLSVLSTYTCTYTTYTSLPARDSNIILVNLLIRYMHGSMSILYSSQCWARVFSNENIWVVFHHTSYIPLYLYLLVYHHHHIYIYKYSYVHIYK